MGRMKDVLIILVGVLAALYLINPGAGILEFLPDNLPLVGNLDEATATAVLLAAFRYFGYDAAQLFKRRDENTVVTPRQ
jgi:hypothetical protein